MVASSPAKAASCFASGVCAALLSLSCAAAQDADASKEAIDYSADLVKSDPRQDTLHLSGHVSFLQGNNSIAAEQARAHAPGTDRSEWTFEKSVTVRTPEASLRADTASAAFANGRIAVARAEGSPAEFEQLNGPPERQGRGRAKVIEYDLVRGLVKLTGGSEPVWFVYGEDQNEFRSPEVTYNLRDGSVSTGRARGTIHLREKPAAPSAPRQSSDSGSSDAPRSPRE